MPTLAAWRWRILAIALALLAACSTPPAVPSASVCPEPKPYTSAEERRAAAELLALPSESIVAVMITDYGRERAELRACRSPP